MFRPNSGESRRGDVPDLTTLTNARVTKGKYLGGELFRIDDYVVSIRHCTPENAVEEYLGREWIGRTEFPKYAKEQTEPGSKKTAKRRAWNAAAVVPHPWSDAAAANAVGEAFVPDRIIDDELEKYKLSSGQTKASTCTTSA